MLITDLSQYNKKVAIEHLMGIEGGEKFTDIKADAGGKTRFGVTEATALEHKHLWPKHNWNGDMRTLPYALAFEIYELSWWNRLRLDDILAIHPLLANQMLDFGVNAGRPLAAKSLQRIVNIFNNEGKLYADVEPDGVLGTKTIDALKALVKARGKDSVVNVITVLQSIQNVHYLELAERKSSQELFSFGWSNRVKDATINTVKFLLKK